MTQNKGMKQTRRPYKSRTYLAVADNGVSFYGPNTFDTLVNEIQGNEENPSEYVFHLIDPNKGKKPKVKFTITSR